MPSNRRQGIDDLPGDFNRFSRIVISGKKSDERGGQRTIKHEHDSRQDHPAHSPQRGTFSSFLLYGFYIDNPQPSFCKSFLLKIW